MTTGQSNDNDTDHSQQSPFVDPDHLSIQIAQKLAGQKPIEYTPPPRLSIAHLFLWTTLSAIVMAVGRSIFLQRETAFDSPEYVTLHKTYWFVMSILYGLQGTGLCVEAMRWSRHGRILLEPGEWLLIIFGGVNLVALAVYALREIWVGERQDIESYLVTYGLLVVLALIALAVGAWKIAASSAWRLIFITSLVMNAVEALLIWGFDAFMWFSWNGVLTYFTSTVQGLLWVIAVTRDRRYWPERNWLHWIGVFTFIALVLFEVMWDVAWRAVINR